MDSIKIRSHVGSDGILHLDVPVGFCDEEIEVTVMVEKVGPVVKSPENLGWPVGFFERTWGSCADDPIVIDDEGICEELDDNLDGVFDEEVEIG
ncbi:MAG TPA: hypothetical protein V6D13_05930 [Halomicronema sp.]|jgi:hypothetical protein